MLSLRSIWREVDVVEGQQLDSTRKILHGLKATQDDAVNGKLGTGLTTEGQALKSDFKGLNSSVRSLRSEV